MAKATKYEATAEADTKTWTVALQFEGFGGSVTTVNMVDELRLTYERGDLKSEQPLISSYVPVTIEDPDGSIYSDLTTTSEEDWRLYLSNDTDSQEWYGRVRRDTVKTRLVPGIQTRFTRLYSYCGLSRASNLNALKDFSAHLTQTFGHYLVEPIRDGAFADRDLVNLISTFYHVNRGAGATIDDIEIRNAFLNIGDDDVDDGEKVLQSICRAFDLWYWMSLTDGKWRLQQPHTIGQQVTSGSRDFQTYDASTDSWSESGSNLPAADVSITDADIHWEVNETKAPNMRLYKDKRVYYREDAPLQIIKNKDVEIWTNADHPDGWVAVAPSGDLTEETTITHSGGSSVKMEHVTTEPSIYQETINVAEDSDIVVDGSFWIQYENQTGTTNTAQAKLTIRIEPFGANNNDSVWYLQDDNTWGSTSNRIDLSSRSLTDLENSNWIQETFTSTGVIPVTGVLIIEIHGDDTSGMIVYFDDSECEIKTRDGSDKTEWNSYFYDFKGTGAVVSGVVYENERSFMNLEEFSVPRWLMRQKTNGDPIGEWEYTRSGATSSPFHDFPEIKADLFKRRRAADASGIDALIVEGESHIDKLVPPGKSLTYNGTTYIFGGRVTLDLLEETTLDAVFIEKLETY